MSRGWEDQTSLASRPQPPLPLTHHALLQRLLDVPGVCHWEPDLGDDALLGDVNVAHIQDMVDGLHLLHFDDPGVPVGGCFLQEALPVRLCLGNDLAESKKRKTIGVFDKMAKAGVHLP